VLRQRPSCDERDTVTCLHDAGLALVNSILVQSISRRDGRGQYCLELKFRFENRSTLSLIQFVNLNITRK